GLILGILTADCTPVLFTDEKAGVVGVAHAGWKGALTGVLSNTILAMEKLGADRADIRTAIGPTIHQDSYEVGADFRAHFADIESGFASYFNRGKDVEHYQFDLPGFVRDQLKSQDIRHIWNARIDTYKSADHFSYRRTTHLKEPDYGRQLSGIMLPR
ncbi:MAG: polyphenol oxidase family protein, partial [Kordiimonas sp.]